ncbi:hypothetical protein N9J36_02840 [Litoricola sp.]|nr:hypothetical protein [Litorivicinus sp.]
MIVIHHHINLVGWDTLLENHLDYGDRKSFYYCDSWSLFVIGLFWGRVLRRFPGTERFFSFKINSEFLFLTARYLPVNHIILPSFGDLSSYVEFAERFATKHENLVIGISSPKQNLLAYIISRTSDLPENLHIYCLGAAIYLAKKPSSRIPFINFFISSPGRFAMKVYQTCHFCTLAFLHPRKFSRFLDLF